MNFKLVPEEQFDYIKLEIEQIKKALEKISSVQVEQKRLMTNEEVSKYLSLSSRTLQNYRDKGMIDFIQIGRKIYYESEVVSDFLAKYRMSAWDKNEGGGNEN